MTPRSDRYQILKHLASGGMAEVFLARDRAPSGIEKLVVLKRVLPQHARDAEYLRMFRDEARIGALLQHPNLVQMFELGSHEGVPFISMEYLNGEDVRGIYKVLRERGQPLGLDIAMTLLTQVTAGLHYAHERVGLDGRPLNIVHRDVSPQNVVVTYEGGVKVVDFGIARSENRENQTRNAVMKGKIAYMAPEQVMAEPLDRRTDLYAVGVMLYEMTTGQRPFRRDNEVATMRAIVDEPLPSPQKLVPGYPPTLAAIVLKAMARKREDRFQSAQELQGALEEFARERGLSLSSLALSRFMVELFGAKASAFHEVLIGARPAESLPVAPRSGDEDVEPAVPDTSTGITNEAARATTTLPSMRNATLERVGPVTVVHFKGKLNEQFSGAELGRALSGQVVFDLRQVERVTSYGVREWLQMLGACEAALTGLYLAHCSEAIVSQLSMIKRFAGPGKVVSFCAPYHCRPCGQSFQATLDVEPNLETLTRHVMPPQPCPSCRSAADFDDDARSYLAFGPQRVGPLSPVVESVLTTLALAAAAPAERVEKTFEGTATRVKVRAPLDATIRWHRVLDGVEGEVCVELGEVLRFEDAGARLLAAALEGLGPEVTRIVLEGAPRGTLEAARAGITRGRIEVGSVLLEGECPTCKAARTALVRWAEVRAAVEEGRPPFAPCKRCNGPLTLSELGWAPGLKVVAAPATTVPVPAPESPGSSKKLTARKASASIGLLVVLLFGASLARMVWSRPTRGPPADHPTQPTQPVQAPAWAAGPQVVEGPDRVFSWGHAGPLPDETAALVQAEAAAIGALADLFLPPGPDGERFRRKAGDRAGAELAEATRWRLRSAAMAVERRSAPSAMGIEAWVQVDLSAREVAAVRREAAARLEFRGATLVAVPPWWSGAPVAGALYVLRVAPRSAAMGAGLREGDLVVELQAEPVGEVSALGFLAEGLKAQAVTLRVNAQGVTRTLKVAP